MENIVMQSEKVSIIVPLYNSEERFGRCLNSIISQSYRNIEVIVVNDGSTDNSAQICENYCRWDKRIKLLNIDNSGVSNARNVGIQAATGKYIQFVDSDDMIDIFMTEKMVAASKMYNSDLVICGMNLLEIDNYENLISSIHLTSSFLGDECVLNRDKFFDRLAYLLWHTSLLEGPCNKLYLREYFKDFGIDFPLGISLGEDLLMNLQYFVHLNKIVLLKNEYYFYIKKADSLSTIYREDRFQIDMLLIEKIKNCIQAENKYDEQQECYLSEYTFSKALQCIECMFVEKNMMDETQIKHQIDLIINDSRVKNAYEKVLFIDEKWEWIKGYMDFSDVGGIYSRFKNRKVAVSNLRSIENELVLSPSFFNDCICAFCLMILKIFPNKKLWHFRDILSRYGFKITFKRYLNKIFT